MIVIFFPGTCWYRQYITDSYPEGTAWLSQQFKVTSLSIGPNNQVNGNKMYRWAISSCTVVCFFLKIPPFARRVIFVDKRSGYKITRRVKRRAGVKFLPEGCDPHTRALCFCTLSRSFFWRLLAFSTKAKIWLRADHLTFELIWFGQESLVETEIFPQRISP